MRTYRTSDTRNDCYGAAAVLNRELFLYDLETNISLRLTQQAFLFYQLTTNGEKHLLEHKRIY